jgi:hypothetical protein
LSVELKLAGFALLCGVGAGVLSLIVGIARLFILTSRHPESDFMPGLDMITFTKHISVPVAAVTFIVALLLLLYKRGGG